MKYNEIIFKIYELDSTSDRQPLFDWIIKETDELFTNNEFDVMNQVFENIDPRKLSISAIVALLRFTFVAKNNLPARKLFIENKITTNIVLSEREDGAKFLEEIK